MNLIQKIGSMFADKPIMKTEMSDDRLMQMLNIIATRYSYTMENAFDMLTNPDEILNKNNKTIEEYSKFKYDAHVYSCIQSRKSAVLSLEFEISNSGKETSESKFITDIFSKLDLRRILSEMLDAPLYGYKPMEIYWSLDGNYIVPSDIVGKPPHWFGFDSLNLLRFKRVDRPNGELVPRQKFLVLQSEATYDNPYGEAVLAKCFYPVIFKKGGLKLWSVFTEKFGMPYLHGKLLAGSSKEDFDDLLIKLISLRQDGVIITEDNTDIELKESSKTSSADVYKSLLHFCNAEISKAILSQTLTTEQGDTGSYAMSQTHLQVRKDVVDSDKKLIESALNKLIKWIIDYNFPNPTDYPHFVMYEEEDVDKTLADRDAALVPVLQNSGLKYSKKYLQEAYNLDDDDLEEAVQPTKPGMFAENNGNPDSLLELSKIGAEDFANSFNKIMEPVLKMINGGSSFEEIQKKLIKIFPTIDSKQVEEILAYGMILSSVGGKVAGMKK